MDDIKRPQSLADVKLPGQDAPAGTPPTQTAPAPTVPQFTAPAQPVDVTTSVPVSSLAPSPAPVPATPPVDTPPVSTPITVNTDDAPVDPSAQESPNSLTIPADPVSARQGGGKGHLVAIVVAVLVMLALGGAAVYYYLQQNSGTIKTTQSNATGTEAPAEVTVGDVDDAAKSIDDNLNAVEADKDFNSNDLSDATLGL